MGPYYDAVSLMIWRLPEPRQTPWSRFQDSGEQSAQPMRRLGVGERLRRRLEARPLRLADQLP